MSERHVANRPKASAEIPNQRSGLGERRWSPAAPIVLFFDLVYAFESLIFILIGLELPYVVRDLHLPATGSLLREAPIVHVCVAVARLCAARDGPCHEFAGGGASDCEERVMHESHTHLMRALT